MSRLPIVSMIGVLIALNQIKMANIPSFSGTTSFVKQKFNTPILRRGFLTILSGGIFQCDVYLKICSSLLIIGMIFLGRASLYEMV